jgi:drug/metabolite transporter (DMT)-like permease
MPDKTSSHSRYLPFLALAGLALLWGYNWPAMKIGTRYCDPFTFAALRNFLSGVVILGVAAARRRPLLPRPFWWTVLYGVFQTSLFALPVWAVHLGGAGKSSVLTYTMPFWVVLIAWPALGERIRGLQWAAVALALGGLVLILGPWGLKNVTATLLALSGGISWAIGSVLFKIMRRRHQVELLSFTAWQSMLGSIPLIVIALLVDHTGPTWNGTLIGILLYNILPAGALAYVLWTYALNNLSAGTAGMNSLAVPVVGVLAAWLQLGEQPSLFEALGMALIVLALALLAVWGLLQERRSRRGYLADPLH